MQEGQIQLLLLKHIKFINAKFQALEYALEHANIDTYRIYEKKFIELRDEINANPEIDDLIKKLDLEERNNLSS